MAWKTSGFYKYGISGVAPNGNEFSNIVTASDLSVDDNHCLFYGELEQQIIIYLHTHIFIIYA